MKKLLLTVFCVFAITQLQAQQSVRLVLDIKPNTTFEITSEEKNSNITNLLGNKELIDMIKASGTEYPIYQTLEINSDYLVNWKNGDKDKLNFSVDLGKSVIRKFKSISLLSTDKEGSAKNITEGYLNKDGIKQTRALAEKYKASSDGLSTLLDDLFNSSGFSKTPIKVNETFITNGKKNIKLTDENAVEVSTQDTSKVVKIEKKKAYLTIESVITSESKGSKFAEMKGKGTKEVVYNIEKQYIESISGTVSIIVNIETEGGLTINMTNNITQKVKAKIKE
ncbi:hypothetical protein [Myroides sp. N17-2]|uniref:hypothetical protein n=1 Tax=Myroides sp. N17-2 TaxID=2030799 RepID=UPI000EFD30EF|nr:hypothetical protein [Myroides sp. N17-2]